MNNNQIPDHFKELLFASQQKNLVYNYNFLYFSNKTIKDKPDNYDYGHPDGWIYKGNGKIGFNDIKNCCYIDTDTENMVFSQALHEFPRWMDLLIGQTVTAKAHLNLENDATIKFSLSDGITTKTSSISSSGDIEMQVQLKVNEDAKRLKLKIECDTANIVINISKVYANIGSTALASNPCIVNGVIGERKQYIATENTPAEELSLCKASEELKSDYSRLDSVLNKRFGAGPNNISLLPDMRGYFSRAWNNDSGIDTGANNRTNLGKSDITGDHVSTAELDEFKEHDHTVPFVDGAVVAGEASLNLIINKENTSTSKTGGKETRPKNIAELYTIKWA
ncbi:MAG: hypothetical protein IMY72_11225 [Bacteroidetes bacterium]|nr:hypothetical protein [Bacteroidota bacterium]